MSDTISLAALGLASKAIPGMGQIFTPVGAKADGINDDSNALIAAINKAIASNGTVLLGSGIYRITKPLATLVSTPISIVGDSSNPSVIYVDPSMSGDVLSFSNCWYGADRIINTASATVADTILGVKWATLTTSKKSGVVLRNFRIIGDRSTPNTQNGIMLYDRNDAVVMENVRVDFIRGIGLMLAGIPSNPSNNAATVIRESRIVGCRVRWCGDWGTGRPAFMYNSSSKTAAQSPGGIAANSTDDANNYNDIIDLQVIYPEGIGIQSNCHNFNSNSMSNSRVQVIVDSQRGPPASANTIPGGLVSTGHTSITNGVMTITAGGTFTLMNGSGSGNLTVGTFVESQNVPFGTYISQILSGPNADGSGTYQLANYSVDVSTLTVSSGTMGSCRFTTPMVEIGGGHVGEDWSITVNGSNTIGTNGTAIAFNQNPLNGNTPKTQECLHTWSIGGIDLGILMVVVNSLNARLKIRNATTGISALSITQAVTVDLGEFLTSGEIAIGGNMQNLHVYPGGQKVVYGASMPMNANKWPNCEMYLNNTGALTRWVSVPASPNYTSCSWVQT